jgi:hypothetical protein
VILAAALLVLLGLALFVGGVLTKITVLYWLCVVACVVAGVFLVGARARMSRAAGRARPAGTPSSAGAEPAGAPATGADAPTGPQQAVTATAVQPIPAYEPESANTFVPEPAPTTESPASTTEPPTPPTDESARDAVEAEEPATEHFSRLAAAAAHEPPSTGAHAPRGVAGTAGDSSGEPPVEEVEVTDLLIVVDLRDEVLVIDEHPRYHLPGCRAVRERETILLPLDEARADGFTPCAWCGPDGTLAQRERSRRHGR